MDQLHFSMHPSVDILILCAYCLTTMQICICVMRQAGLHYICQQVEATWRFLGYYLNTVQRLMPRLTVNLPHFSLLQDMGLQMSCNYCWTIMQTHKHAAMMEALHCIVLQNV